MKHLKLFFALAILSTFISCEKDAATSAEVAPLEDKDVTYFHHEETDEMLEFADLNDLYDFYKENYSDRADLDQILNRILVFKAELEYSKSLNLEDPLVAETYEARLEKKYGNNDNKIAAGKLNDYNGTYLQGTAVPRNMRRSRRNRADIWTAYQNGPIFLCDRTWFRSPRIFMVGIPGIPFDLAQDGFTNRTESFF